jgi:hypothetical protein
MHLSNIGGDSRGKETGVMGKKRRKTSKGIRPYYYFCSQTWKAQQQLWTFFSILADPFGSHAHPVISAVCFEQEKEKMRIKLLHWKFGSNGSHLGSANAVCAL